MGIEAIEFDGVRAQIVAQTYRLVRNMRNNANGYITQANQNFDPVVLGIVMKGDADRFLERIDTITQAVQRNQAVVQGALALIGITLAQANTLKTTLIATMNHVKAATLTTKQQCIDEANAILTGTPSYDGLWEE